MNTTLRVVCMYCGGFMRHKDGHGSTGVSHSICETCWHEHFPYWGYPDEDEENIDATGKQAD